MPIRSRTASHGLVRDTQAVGSHVGDEPDRAGAVDVDALVKLLGNLHRSLAGEPQADRRLLLERAGLERGIGLVELIGFIDPGHDVSGRGEFVADRAGIGLGTGRELGAVVLGQRGLEPVGTRPSVPAG